MKKYFLGCSGWYYDAWANLFYPEELNKANWLEYYAKHFNTVEVNSTFYHFPNKKMLKSWFRKTPGEFIFTLKANQIITHKKKFKGTERLVKSFYQLASLLENKLGCIMFQLPEIIHKDITLLNSITDQLDRRRNNILEFRHPSWFCDEVYDILRENQIGFCTVSAPNLPEDLAITSDNVYLRFHGKTGWYKYEYSKQELQRWAEKIKKVKAKKIFCYFNNDYQAYAAKNCSELKKILEQD